VRNFGAKGDGVTEKSAEGRQRRFTGELWDAIRPVYSAILEHPFLRGLADGTLPEDRFRYYVLQDAIYLRSFARALSLAGVRAGDESTLLMFDEHSAGTIAVERSLYEDFLEDLDVTREEAEATEAFPTTLAYTSFLLKTAALGDYPEVLSAVLPCYWIYREVGKTLVEYGSPEPRYGKWIDAYAGEEFDELVEAVLDLTDRVCEDLGPSQKTRVRKAFVAASRYEWMFWDVAWRMERWPVG
jgi:thiaminase/transcriptional activator TenA